MNTDTTTTTTTSIIHHDGWTPAATKTAWRLAYGHSHG